jgi:hypothetical protein
LRDHENALQSRSGCDDVPIPCRNCRHDNHFGEMCGERVNQKRLWPFCSCENYEPLTKEDVMADERPEEV